MIIIVKNLKGITSLFEVELSETVESLIQKIQEKEKINADEFSLVFQGRKLEKYKQLGNY